MMFYISIYHFQIWEKYTLPLKVSILWHFNLKSFEPHKLQNFDNVAYSLSFFVCLDGN
jgi:hypothetical protein